MAIVVVVSDVDCNGGLIVPQAVIANTMADESTAQYILFSYVNPPFYTIDQIYSGAVRVKIRQPKIMAMGVHSN